MDPNDDWVLRGTEPKLENFAKFNFSGSGLLFSFDEYSIGPYAFGRQEVLVPFTELSDVVSSAELKAKA
jgi:hypothetical protein